jgi:AraC-like DNA-binding protein
MVDSSSGRLPADPLSGMFAAVDLHGTILCRADLARPWGYAVDGFDDVSFYFVGEGRARLEVAGYPGIDLLAGEIALVAPKQRHALRDRAGSPLVPMARLAAAARRGHGVVRRPGRAVATRLVCGCFGFGTSARALLLSTLPPVLRVRAPEAEGSFVAVVHALATEAATAPPGAQPVLDRLAEVLFIQALRAYARDAGAGWLRALSDPALASVLAAMHDRPEHGWSVASLGAVAGMSRSTFAAHFARHVGESPMHYLTRYRMQRAAAHLERDPLPIKSIARRVGYGSDEAFHRAFKQVMGITPARYRLQERRAVSERGARTISARSSDRGRD